MIQMPTPDEPYAAKAPFAFACWSATRQQRALRRVIAVLTLCFALSPRASSAESFTDLVAWQPTADLAMRGPADLPSRAPVPAASVTDPVGDTFGNVGVQHDVTELALATDGTDLNIELTFVGAISPADSGQPDALVGFIDLDVDQDPMTGVAPAVDTFCPIGPAGLGDDFFVNVQGYSSATADVPIFDANTFTEIGRAPAIFSPTSVTIEVPLTLLNGDDGAVHAAAVLGPFGAPSDCVPDGTFLSNEAEAAPIPTLSEWMLILFALLLVTIGWRRMA